jgi:hypothetical protein
VSRSAESVSGLTPSSLRLSMYSSEFSPLLMLLIATASSPAMSGSSMTAMFVSSAVPLSGFRKNPNTSLNSVPTNSSYSSEPNT